MRKKYRFSRKTLMVLLFPVAYALTFIVIEWISVYLLDLWPRNLWLPNAEPSPDNSFHFALQRMLPLFLGYAFLSHLGSLSLLSNWVYRTAVIRFALVEGLSGIVALPLTFVVVPWIIDNILPTEWLLTSLLGFGLEFLAPAFGTFLVGGVVRFIEEKQNNSLQSRPG